MEHKPLSVIIVFCLLAASCCWAQGSRASWAAAVRSGGKVVHQQDGFELRKVHDSLYWLNDWQLPYPVYQFQTGDVDGDGRADAMVGVIKSTRYYPEKARRLFIFKQVVKRRKRASKAEQASAQSEAQPSSQSANQAPAQSSAVDSLLARPLWMGSKLGGILEDFRYKDGGIRALESTTDSLYTVADYRWASFGMGFEHFIIKGTDKQTAIKYFSQ